MLGFNLAVKDNVSPALKQSKIAIPELTQDELEKLMGDIVEDVEVYPPETAANNPPPPYYKRGTGYYGRTGKLTKPSEQLGTRWGFELNPTRAGMEGLIYNRATYSAYVQDGKDEKPHQTPWHAQTGWKTVQQSADENMPSAMSRFVNRLTSKLNSIFGK